MKKIILIIVSCIMLLTLIVLPSSAESEAVTPTAYFAFKETQKAYPLYLSLDECVGFMEYYQSDDITYTFIPNESPPIMSQSLKIVSSKNNGTVNVEMLIRDEQYGGEYQFISLEDPYDDFAFYVSSYNSSIGSLNVALVGIKDGEKTVIYGDFLGIFPAGTNYPYERLSILELPEGYYVGNGEEETPEDTIPDTPTNPDRVYSSGFGLYINPNDIKDYNKQMVYDVPEWTVVPDNLTTAEMTKYGFIGKMFNVGEVNANNYVFDFSLYNQDYTQRLRITYSGSNYNIINVTVESDVSDHLGYGSTPLFNSFNSKYDFMIYKYDTDHDKTSPAYTEYRYCVFDKTTGEVKSVGVNNYTLLFTSIMPYNPYYEDNPSDHEDCIGYENGYNEGLQHANKLEYDKGYAQGVADTKDGMNLGEYKYTEEDLENKYNEGYLVGQDSKNIVSIAINGFFDGLTSFFSPFMSIGIGSLTVYSMVGLALITAIIFVIIKVVRG